MTPRLLGKLSARAPHPARVAAADRAFAGVRTGLAGTVQIDCRGGIQQWDVLGNNRVGDCAVVGMLTIQRAWAARNGKTYRPSEQDALDVYMRLSGYNGTEATDTGLVLADVLDAWERATIGAGQLTGHVPLGKDHDRIAAACMIFNGVYPGWQLPNEVRDKSEWSDTSGEPGTWGGHCAAIVEVNSTGGIVVSWGEEIPFTWPFFDKYCDEAHALWCEPLWDPSGRMAPNGIDLAHLANDLAMIGLP